MQPANPGATSLIEQVRRVGQATSVDLRRQALDALARTVQQTKAMPTVFARLLAADVGAQRIALELILRLPLPLDEPLVLLLVPAIGRKDFPSALRIAVVAQMLRSIPEQSQRMADILQSLIADASRSKAIERLRILQRRVRECDPLDALILRLEQRVQMRCPRCEVRLPRTEMVKHLWQEHKLMLDGQNVREPWRMIEDWVTEYARTGAPEPLERCGELAEQLDAEQGLMRVHRLLLNAGVSDDDALQTLRSEAVQRQATLCPHCFALVPMPTEVSPPVMSQAKGRLSCRGYTVEVNDLGPVRAVSILTPTGTIYDGFDRSGMWTKKGRIIVLVGGWVVLALVLAFTLPVAMLPPFRPVALVLLLAFMTYISIWLRSRNEPSLSTRAIDTAWSQLVPELHPNGFTVADSAYIRALADVSIEVGQPKLRESELTRSAQFLTDAVTYQAAPLQDLVAIRRLEIADAAELQRDPMLLLSQQVALSFREELPLEYAERMLSGWQSLRWWTPDNRVRLQVLLCVSAFEAGWEAPELHELGHYVPLLGEVMGSDPIDHIACLRRLWMLKNERTWNDAGHAMPIFDLARFPLLGGQYLEKYPDLLLLQPTTAGEMPDGRNEPILICRRGVIYRDWVISDPKAEVTIRSRPLWQGGGHELVCGSLRQSYREEPIAVAKQLQGWLHFLYRVFLPSVDDMLKRHAPEMLQRLLRQRLVTCPECRESLLGRRGERGEMRPRDV